MPLTVYPCDAPRGGVILAPGAGAGQGSAFMVRLGRSLAQRGFAAATFDFPYMIAGRHVPDRTPVLEESWREAIAEGRRDWGPLPLFIGGKSMGGRIASNVAAGKNVGTLAGVVFFGYPLHPPGKPDQRRDAHLPSIEEPMLFVQGSRDTFGTAAEIREMLPRLQRATLHEVVGGDHSLKVLARDRAGTADPLEEAIAAAAAWMDAHAH
ncbi:MAG TPA: alpha/beta family hydrolase [Chloroflexota bacterium]|nr:alpha/beta family hydrolase [Chloroflexota bacterium]